MLLKYRDEVFDVTTYFLKFSWLLLLHLNKEVSECVQVTFCTFMCVCFYLHHKPCLPFCILPTASSCQRERRAIDVWVRSMMCVMRSSVCAAHTAGWPVLPSNVTLCLTCFSDMRAARQLVTSSSACRSCDLPWNFIDLSGGFFFKSKTCTCLLMAAIFSAKMQMPSCKISKKPWKWCVGKGKNRVLLLKAAKPHHHLVLSISHYPHNVPRSWCCHRLEFIIASDFIRTFISPVTCN